MDYRNSASETSEMIIRPAAAEDLAAVAAIYERILAKEAEGVYTTGWLPGVYPTSITAESSLKKGELYVLELGCRILAAARLNKEQEASYRLGQWLYPAADTEVLVIHTLVVDPEAEGLGCARAFLKYYEQRAKANGCRVLRLDTNARNTRAREMYLHYGYREAGIVPCEFNGIPDVNLVLLEKLL